MTPYAVEADLVGWLTGTDYPVPSTDRATRMLARASEVIDDHVFGRYEVDSDTLAPTDPAVVEALRDAACAQVEQWLEVGEENDVAGYPADTAVSASGLSVNKLPPELGRRADRILRRAGLRGTSIARTT